MSIKDQTLLVVEKFGPFKFGELVARLGTTEKDLRSAINMLLREGQLINIGQKHLAIYEVPGSERTKNITPARTVSVMGGDFDPSTVQISAVRIGAEDHRKYPSRNGNTLRYLDGRTERVE